MAIHSMKIADEGVTAIRRVLVFYRQHLIVQHQLRQHSLQENGKMAASSEGVTAEDIHTKQTHIINVLLQSFQGNPAPERAEPSPLLYPALHELDAQPSASPFSDQWEMDHSTNPSKTTSISDDWGLVNPARSEPKSEANSLTSAHPPSTPTPALKSVAPPETPQHSRLDASHPSQIKRKPVPDLASQALPSSHYQHSVPQVPESAPKQCQCTTSFSTHHVTLSHTQSEPLLPPQAHQHAPNLQSMSHAHAEAQLIHSDPAYTHPHTPNPSETYHRTTAAAILGSGVDNNTRPWAGLSNSPHICDSCPNSLSSSEKQRSQEPFCQPSIRSPTASNAQGEPIQTYSPYRPYDARARQQSHPDVRKIPTECEPATTRQQYPPIPPPHPSLEQSSKECTELGCRSASLPFQTPVPETSTAMPPGPRLREQVTFNTAVLGTWNRPAGTGEPCDSLQSNSPYGPGAAVSQHASDPMSSLNMENTPQFDQGSQWQPLDISKTPREPYGDLHHSTREANAPVTGYQPGPTPPGNGHALTDGHQHLRRVIGNVQAGQHPSMPPHGLPLDGDTVPIRAGQAPTSDPTHEPDLGGSRNYQSFTSAASHTASGGSWQEHTPRHRASHHSGLSSNILRPSGFAPLKQPDPVPQPPNVMHSTPAGFALQDKSCEVKPNTLRPRQTVRTKDPQEPLSIPPESLPTYRRGAKLQDHQATSQSGLDSSGSTFPPMVDNDDLAALREMQDKFNREDEMALAKQEAFAQQIQDQWNGSPGLKSSGSRTRGRRLGESVQSRFAAATTQGLEGGAAFVNPVPSGTQSSPKPATRDKIQFAPAIGDDDDDDPLRHLVVVKQPTITNASLSTPQRQSSVAGTGAESCNTNAAKEIAKYEAAQRAQEDLAKEAARKKLAATQPSHASEKIACTACGDKDSLSALASLPCGHHYCGICIADAFKHALSDGKVFICCNKTPVPVSLAAPFLPLELVTQYKTKLEERTTANPVYCAKPGCSAFIPPSNLKGPLATCGKCGFVSCSLCKNPEHKGVCPPDKLGLKLMNLAGNKNWVQCKRCNAVVERDDGCLHMTCTCGYEFCYSCGGPWDLCGASCPRKA